MSRKHFLRLTSLLLLIYPGKLFFDLIKSSRNRLTNEVQQTLPMNLPDGITFHDDIIVNKSGKDIHFYSAICPHLGCRINRSDNEELICPCHGSRFSVEGKLVEGPATGDLTELRYTADMSSKRFIVYLPT